MDDDDIIPARSPDSLVSSEDHEEGRHCGPLDSARAMLTSESNGSGVASRSPLQGMHMVETVRP